MIPNLVLSILTGLFTIAAVANSVASSRYARQAKASAERAVAAASRAEAARQRIAELRKELPQPTRLTYEQLLPLAAAIRHRESAIRAGAGLCPPFPDCPDCGQTPTELLVRNDHPAQFLEDRVGFGFRPCGHTFTADAEDVYRATEQP